jgi:hypothetical protein
LEPAKCKKANVEFVVLEVISKDWKLNLDKSFEDETASFQTAQLRPIKVPEVENRKERVHDSITSLFYD